MITFECGALIHLSYQTLDSIAAQHCTALMHLVWKVAYALPTDDYLPLSSPPIRK